MTKEENFERVKKSFGSRFPVGLEDKDYEMIYAKLEKDHLVESAHGNLRLTEKGRKELKILAEKPVAYSAWTGGMLGDCRRFVGEEETDIGIVKADMLKKTCVENTRKYLLVIKK